jgi:hypothetical protein
MSQCHGIDQLSAVRRRPVDGLGDRRQLRVEKRSFVPSLNFSLLVNVHPLVSGSSPVCAHGFGCQPDNEDPMKGRARFTFREGLQV